MKSYKKIALLFTALGTMSVSSCKKFLEQEPRANVTLDFFATPGGALGGITGVYSDMRNLWGTEGFLYYTQMGTDESLAAGGASSGGNAFATYKNYVNNVSDVYNAMGGLWNLAYSDINVLNGVIQNGPTAFSNAAQRTANVAQAKFLRAFLYFHLVETFGDVPLHTTYNTSAIYTDTRAKAVDVWAQIIKDLTEASTELQSRPGESIGGAPSPFSGHAATKASALALLAKSYLTRGWSAAAQANDFQIALTTAQTLINNAGIYGKGLYANYADAYAPASDASNMEDLFSIEHSTDPKYGDYVSQPSSGKVNGWAWFFRPNYPTVTATYPGNTGSVMTRDLANGRPFFRTRPNSDYVENVVFADKTNDYRYWNTFQTTWIANTLVNSQPVSTPRGTLTVGQDTAIWMPPYDPGAAKRASFKGIIFIRLSLASATTGANPYTGTFFPSVKKFDDPNRPAVNDASQRPNVILRLSEVYLIGAEAAFKAGDNGEAARLLTILRTRATVRPATAPAAPADAVSKMQLTAADVQAGGIDLILDERSRELYGESLRWWDLVRTKQLLVRLRRYNAEAAINIDPNGKKDVYTPADNYNFLMLRPIPQTQIDLVTQGPKFLQNPGF